MLSLSTKVADRKCHRGAGVRECRYLIASPMGMACALTSHALRKKVESGETNRTGRGAACSNPYDEKSESQWDGQRA